MEIEYTVAYFSVISFGAFFPKFSLIVDLNNENDDKNDDKNDDNSDGI